MMSENAFARFAVLTAIPAAQWLDPRAMLPKSDHWPRSEVLPRPGTERLVSVILQKDVQPSLGEKLWLLFIPGLGAENGWEEHPKMISASAFVQGRVIAREGEWLRTGAVWTWLRVAVCDVVPFLELERRYPAQRMPRLETWGHSRGELIQCDGWELLWAPEDDAGHWLLGRRKSDDVAVLAGGEWVLDFDFAWAGHVIVPVAEWQRICTRQA